MFTDTECALIGAVVNDRIDELDRQIAADRAGAERLGLTADVSTLLLARAIFTGIARKVQQRLDVPFVTAEDMVLS